MKVMINNDRKHPESIQEVSAELIKENSQSVWVRLQDGHVIKRRKAFIVAE